MQCPQCGRTNRNDAKSCFACKADLRATPQEERPMSPLERDYSEEDVTRSPIYEKSEPESAPEEEVKTIYQKDNVEEEKIIDEIYEYMMPEESEIEDTREEDDFIPIYEEEVVEPELHVIYDEEPKTTPCAEGASERSPATSKPPPPPNDDEDEEFVVSAPQEKKQKYEVVFDDEEDVVFDDSESQEFEIVQTKDLDPKRASLIALIKTLMSRVNNLRHHGKNVKEVEVKVAVVLSCQDPDKKHTLAKECLEMINKLEVENDQERFQDTARKYHEIRAKILVLGKQGKDVNTISSLLDDASSAIAMSDFLKAEMLIGEIEKKISTL
jgi:hypothetical protein